MPSFLVTKRMAPELAARVQAAVSGQSAHATRQLPLRALLRLTTLACVVAAMAGAVYVQRRNAAELANARDTLLAGMKREASVLTPSDLRLPLRVSNAVRVEATLAYGGDVMVPELRAAGALDATLSRPTLYLRAPLLGLMVPARLTELAQASSKDALLLCLLAPPDSRGEKALRHKASAAAGHGSAWQVAEHVERVAPLLQALPLVTRDWQARVSGAESVTTVASLQKAFDAAPVHAAVRAAKARQLLLVLDEAGDGKGLTELDGERAHDVRVALLDLEDGAPLLRYRGKVDPGALKLSDSSRAEYASGIDSCALALDLRAAIAERPSVASSH